MAQDSVFSVLSEEDEDRYHMECQGTPEAHLDIRFYEYDTADALATARKTGKFIYPRSAVVYLRPPASLKGNIEHPVYFPASAVSTDEAKREIKVVRPADYTLDEMLQEDHLFMLPFYPFSLEKELNSEDPEEQAKALCKIKKLRAGLDKLEQHGTSI